MNTIQHEFFGTLNLERGVDDLFGLFKNQEIVIWEQLDVDCPISLWYKKDEAFQSEMLDVYAEFVKNKDEYTMQARDYIKEALLADNEVWESHQRNFPDKDATLGLMSFVDAMELQSIDLWISDHPEVYMDFMLPFADSEKIVSVVFDKGTTIIGWVMD